MKQIWFLNTLLAAVIFISCGKDESINTDDITKKDFSLIGFAQKGQFIKGSSITAYSLNENLIATGESFPATTRDDLGSFNLSATVVSPYMELRAEGYYFNENRGTTSESPIYLNALVKTSQQTANINLLTTLTSGRIRKLVASGQSFDAAKKQAEKEVLEMFSITLSGGNIGFEEMDISKDGYANAVLFAVSCILQEGRSTGEIQKLIADISAEFELNGTISMALLEKVISNRSSISVGGILENMTEFYNELGVSNYKIPPFYGIIDPRYTMGFHVLLPPLNPTYSFKSEGESIQFSAISYEDFEIVSDSAWISVDITEISGNLYSIITTVSANSNYAERTAEVIVRAKNGNTLYSYKIKQDGSGQCILLNTKNNVSRGLNDIEINVNNVNYPITYHSQSGKYCVYVPYSESGYGISNNPKTVVAGRNGDVLCATFNFGLEIDEYIVDSNSDQIDISSRSVSVVIGLGNNVPCYAALKQFQDINVPNPAEVTLEPVCSALSLRFNNNGNPLKSISKLVVEADADSFLSGEVTACMYPTQNMFDPTYVVPENSYQNKSNKVIIYNTDNDNIISFLVFPQTLSLIKCIAYDKNNNQIFQFSQNVNIELRKGQYVALSVDISKL